MELRRSSRLDALPGHYFESVERRVEEAAAGSARPIINLGRGNPDLPTPPHIVEALRRAAGEPELQRYPPVHGTGEVRRAIAHRYREDHGIVLDPERQVAVFHGAHEALMAAFHALLSPGDLLRFVEPYYPMYPAGAALAGARWAAVPVDERMHPNLAAVPDWSDTGMLLLNSPNNPSGRVLGAGALAEAVAVAAANGFPVVNDFAYATLGFGAEPVPSLLSADPDATVSVEISTMSKSYSMAGWRFGYAVGNASAIRAMQDYQAVAYSSIFGAVQHAAAVALTAEQSSVRRTTEIYRARRDLLVSGLRELGWELDAPEGGFFVWLRVPPGLGVSDGEEFAELLLERAGVAVAPGIGFGEAGRFHVRLSLVHGIALLTELLGRLRAVFGTADASSRAGSDPAE